MDSLMIRKHVDVALKQVDPERRHIVGVASQEVVDRDDDVVLVDGIDLTEFKRNPVLLVDHDRGFVLGRVTALRVEDRPQGKALVFEADILPAGTSARVDEAWAAIVGGARNGLSISFMPIEYDRVPVRDGQRGHTFRSVKLLEISSVSLPSCATCLIERKAWDERRHSRCACGGGGHPADEIVLELDDPSEEVLDVTGFTAEQLARLGRSAAARRQRRGEPFQDPAARHDLIDIEPHEVRQILRGVIRSTLAEAVRRETDAALNRARGRLD